MREMERVPELNDKRIATTIVEIIERWRNMQTGESSKAFFVPEISLRQSLLRVANKIEIIINQLQGYSYTREELAATINEAFIALAADVLIDQNRTILPYQFFTRNTKFGFESPFEYFFRQYGKNGAIIAAYIYPLLYENYDPTLSTLERKVNLAIENVPDAGSRILTIAKTGSANIIEQSVDILVQGYISNPNIPFCLPADVQGTYEDQQLQIVEIENALKNKDGICCYNNLVSIGYCRKIAFLLAYSRGELVQPYPPFPPRLHLDPYPALKVTYVGRKSAKLLGQLKSSHPLAMPTSAPREVDFKIIAVEIQETRTEIAQIDREHELDDHGTLQHLSWCLQIELDHAYFKAREQDRHWNMHRAYDDCLNFTQSSVHNKPYMEAMHTAAQAYLDIDTQPNPRRSVLEGVLYRISQEREQDAKLGHPGQFVHTLLATTKDCTDPSIAVAHYFFLLPKLGDAEALRILMCTKQELYEAAAELRIITEVLKRLNCCLITDDNKKTAAKEIISPTTQSMIPELSTDSFFNRYCIGMESAVKAAYTDNSHNKRTVSVATIVELTAVARQAPEDIDSIVESYNTLRTSEDVQANEVVKMQAIPIAVHIALDKISLWLIHSPKDFVTINPQDEKKNAPVKSYITLVKYLDTNACPPAIQRNLSALKNHYDRKSTLLEVAIAMYQRLSRPDYQEQVAILIADFESDDSLELYQCIASFGCSEESLAHYQSLCTAGYPIRKCLDILHHHTKESLKLIYIITIWLKVSAPFPPTFDLHDHLQNCPEGIGALKAISADQDPLVPKLLKDYFEQIRRYNQWIPIAEATKSANGNSSALCYNTLDSAYRKYDQKDHTIAVQWMVKVINKDPASLPQACEHYLFLKNYDHAENDIQASIECCTPKVYRAISYLKHADVIDLVAANDNSAASRIIPAQLITALDTVRAYQEDPFVQTAYHHYYEIPLIQARSKAEISDVGRRTRNGSSLSLAIAQTLIDSSSLQLPTGSVLATGEPTAISKISGWLTDKREEAFGLLPLGGKFHFHKVISQKFIDFICTELGLRSEAFQLLNSGKSLNVAAATPVEFQLMAMALRKWGVLADDFGDIQLTVSGRWRHSANWPESVMPYVGSAMLLATPICRTFDPDNFRTTHPNSTGTRVFIYDAQGQKQLQPFDLQSTGTDRTDWLGVLEVAHMPLFYTTIGTLATHWQYADGFKPFQKEFECFRLDMRDLLQSAHLLELVEKSPWVWDPNKGYSVAKKIREREDKEHAEMIQAITDTWHSAIKKPDGGVVAAVRLRIRQSHQFILERADEIATAYPEDTKHFRQPLKHIFAAA